jgi:uncharacterized protein YbaP (TraB family)
MAFFFLLPGIAAWAQEQNYVIQAHPAIWTVHTQNATAYLLGSIHLLPANVQWQTPQIQAAMKKADVFVFEVPIDQAATTQIADYIDKNGTLPKGVTLPSLLSPAQLKDYDTALAATGVKPSAVANKRPWLATLVFDVSSAMHANYSLDSGVDHQVDLYAEANHRKIDHFETVADQLALFTPKDRALELKEFDINLKEIVSDPNELNDLVTAWESGDAAQVAALMNKGLSGDPAAEKALLEDRNVKWVAELKTMLQQKHTYFITVGAGHLVGSKSVPAMLRAAGYKVDGP